MPLSNFSTSTINTFSFDPQDGFKWFSDGFESKLNDFDN